MSKKLKHVFIVEASDYNKCNLEELNLELKKKKNFDYMLYMRSFIGKETDIVRKCCMLFRNEILRFYACGNFEMVEGIIKGLDGYDDREVAFCPLDNKKGMLKNFEENYVNFKIDALINGDVKCIDFIDAGDVCLTNYASVGAMSQVINEISAIKENKKCYWNKLKSIIKIVKDVIFNKNEELEVKIDDNIFEEDYTLAHIANGTSFTKEDNGKSLEDGVLEYILVKKCSVIKKLGIIKRIVDGTLTPMDDLVYMGNCTKFSISNKNGKNVFMSYDGRNEKRNRLEGHVKNKKVKIVVPGV